MSGSRADDIVGDYFESEDWAALADADDEPDVDPPASPQPSAA